MTTDYALFDASSYLDSEEMIAEYLTAAAEDENPDLLLLAIANVAKARGMTHVAKAAGLSRESLYKTLAPGAHPRFETIRAVLRALNVSLSLKPPPLSMKLAKAPRKTTAKAVEPKEQEREAPGNKYHASGAGFRAHGSADARFAKKSAAKRTAKKSAAKR
jgi:probable addiction module antidote protein